MPFKLVAVAALVGACAPMPMWDAFAQPAVPGAQPAGSPTPATPSGALTPGELEEILGPIALYPDDLLANVLAACVYPDEVREAANFVKSGADKKVIDTRDWEDPVKAIAKIPDVVKMMGDYPDWVVAVGQAYLTQSQDVMASVQRLRKKAHDNGALQTTPEQRVEEKDGNVVIVQSDPEVVYVPSYSPSVVYVDDDDDEWAAAAIGFGTGIAVGAIFTGLACNWGGGSIGWGNGDVDIDVNRNFNGNINNIGNGNRVGNGNRTGREGGAWSPNRSKSLATSRPSQAGNFRSGGPGGSSRASAPRASSAGRAPAAPSRTPRAGGASRPSAGARPSTPSRVSAPAGGASRVPAARPSAGTANSAFRGGSDTRASSSRGSSSRQSAGRSSGGGGGSRGGGGGGRGGGRR